MLTVLSYVIYALIVLISIILVILILIQPSKGGGFGSAFGGVGENVFGAHAMEHLSKLTVWLISIFFILALTQTVISGKLITLDRSVVTDSEAAAPEKPAAEKAVQTAAAPEKPAAEKAVQAAAAPEKPAAEKAPEVPK